MFAPASVIRKKYQISRTTLSNWADVVIGALEGPFTYNDTGAQLGGEKLPLGSLSACSPMREQFHD